MELALNFGTPFEHLAQSMTEREFQAWAEYRVKRQLPLARLEIYLAQIACWCARAAGHNVDLQDFIIELADPTSEENKPAIKEATDEDLAAAMTAFAFRPRIKKRKG